jgi:general secretion pathway protein H
MSLIKFAPTEQTGRKVAQVYLPTSPIEAHDEQGFTLLEMLCVLAIISILAAFVLPALPRGTSTAKLQSYALATAALLKTDRNAALRQQVQIATEVNAPSRWIRSGATGRTIRIPDDVSLDTLLARRCDGTASAFTIRFFPSGLSCGGVISLSKSGFGYEIRVNWLTGGVGVVPIKRS